MSGPSLWKRIRSARVVQVLLVYVGASWVVLQLAETLQELLTLPPWVGPVTILLLLVGLLVVLATAWVQSLPQTTAAEEAGEVPSDWEVDAAGVLASLRAGRLPHLTWARAILGGIVALSLLFGGAGLYVIMQSPGGLSVPAEAGASPAPRGIAVLPFQVTGEDLQVYREGMVNLMAANLDGLSDYRAIDARTVLARWSRDVGETADAELAAALDVAAGTGARYAVVGSGVDAGEQVRFTADIYDLADGSKLGEGGQVEGSPDDVLALVDALTVELVRSLLDASDGSSSAPTFRLAGLLTESVPALRYFLEGDAAFRRSRFEEARTSFERAVAEDSTFALAYWRLGETIGWIEGVGSPQAREAKERARALRERLPVREATLLDLAPLVVAGNASARMDELRGYLERYPDDPSGWYLLSEIRLHRRARSGISDEELEEALYTAVELDPSFQPYYVHALEWASAQGQQERFDRLLAGLERAGADPALMEPFRLRWQALWGSDSVRTRAAEEVRSLPGNGPDRATQLLFTEADEALDHLPPLLDAISAPALNRLTVLAMQLRIDSVRTLLPQAGPTGLARAAHHMMNAYYLGAVDRSALRRVFERLPVGSTSTDSWNPVLARSWIAPFVADAETVEASRDSAMANLDRVLEGLAPDWDTTGARRAFARSIESQQRAARGAFEEAYRHLSEVVFTGRVPEWYGPYLGYYAVQAGRRDAAIEILEGRLSSPGERTFALFLLGQAYEATDQDARALDAYRAFLARTGHADPELAPVEEARAAVERLDG